MLGCCIFFLTEWNINREIEMLWKNRDQLCGQTPNTLAGFSSDEFRDKRPLSSIHRGDTMCYLKSKLR